MSGTSGYGKVTGEVVTRLTEMVGAMNVLTGDERGNYARDEMPGAPSFLPEVVVKPENTGTVARILKLANEKRLPVTPRGGGTGLSGGAVPIYGGIVISLERMNLVLEIDEDNFVATVEAGVSLSAFNQAVEERGLYYPIYPGELSATLGGNVATNAGGMRAVKYGVTRDFVVGLAAVLPTGEVIQTGGKFVKCATGYDLTQLLIGSEGTLALITKVMLRLINPPGKREILFVPFHNLHDAIGCVPAILKERILPVGIEFMEKNIIQMVEQYTGKEIPLHEYEDFLMIIVEADSEDEALDLANRIGEVCLKHGAVDVFLPASEKAKRNLLEAREKFYSVIGHFGMQDIADVVVPPSRIAEFVEQVKRIAPEYGLSVVAYGHAGDGNVHWHPLAREKGDAQKVKKIMAEIYRLGISLGGTISGEHGLGFAKKGYLPMAWDKNKIDLMKRVKRAFDPNNIMNPGKIFDLE